jgi:hypothetical protein
MLESSPKQRGVKKTKAGKKLFKQPAYARSRSKRMAKGEEQQSPLTYPQAIGYNY